MLLGKESSSLTLAEYFYPNCSTIGILYSSFLCTYHFKSVAHNSILNYSLFCTVHCDHLTLTGGFFRKAGHNASVVLPIVPSTVLVIWYIFTNSLANHFCVSISFSFLVLGCSINKLFKANYIKVWENKGLYLTKSNV